MDQPKKITLEVGEALYRKIKAACAIEGQTMSAAVRAELEKAFGAKLISRRSADKPRRESKVAA